MKRIGIQVWLVLLGALIALPAWADKPPWAGGQSRSDGYEQGDHERNDNGERDREERGEHERGKSRDRISERSREHIRDYYDRQMRAGRCPPGLAKKHNGCMAPGQARKWKVGQPLPRDVTYYRLPRRLAAQIGPAPAGHEYVRVANDILLIAVGTGMVADAIEDLGRQ